MGRSIPLVTSRCLPRGAAARRGVAAACPVLQRCCWLCYAERRCSRPGGCTVGAVDDIVRDNRETLAGLLEGREDWQPGMQDGERYWYFGVHGAARLVITPEMDGFLMYRSDEDRSWVIPRIELVAEWLDANEAEHAGLTSLQEEFKKALERGEPGTSGT
jgi:hypothetical protein